MYYKLDWKTSSDNSKYSNTSSAPDLDIPWTMGVFSEFIPPTPIICTLNPERGDILRDVYLIDIPLFSNKFLSVIESFGIDNIQKYNAVLKTADGKSISGYSAINIVGLVECVNFDESEFIPGSEPPLMRFKRLVLDSSKAKNFDFFRLGEHSLHIIISEKLKNALDEANLVGYSLIPIEFT